jgi:hypothetical protein
MQISFDGKEYYVKRTNRQRAKREGAHHRKIADLREAKTPAAIAEADRLEDAMYLANILVMRALVALLQKYGFTNVECVMSPGEADHEVAHMASLFVNEEQPSLPLLTEDN